MKLDTLQFATELVVPKSTTIFRIQRRRARAGSLRIGRLRVPGLAEPRRGRFDLAGAVVAYFAESPETAALEVLARREAQFLSIAHAANRQLLYARCSRSLTLVDLRPHAMAWPFLQAMRYRATQELAEDVATAGYEGIVYQSSQHYGAACFAVFGEAALKSLKVTAVEQLTGRSGELHVALAAAVRGSGIPLTA